MASVYGEGIMDLYRQQGEDRMSGGRAVSPPSTPRASVASPRASFADAADADKRGDAHVSRAASLAGGPGALRLPPHVYQTADDAYRAMMRGIDMAGFLRRGALRRRKETAAGAGGEAEAEAPANQSIVSGDVSVPCCVCCSSSRSHLFVTRATGLFIL